MQDYEYDGLSRLTRATDNNDPVATGDDSLVTRAYDSLSRVVEESQQIGAFPPKIVSSAWRRRHLRGWNGPGTGRQEIGQVGEGVADNSIGLKFVGALRTVES